MVYSMRINRIITNKFFIIFIIFACAIIYIYPLLIMFKCNQKLPAIDSATIIKMEPELLFDNSNSHLIWAKEFRSGQFTDEPFPSSIEVPYSISNPIPKSTRLSSRIRCSHSNQSIEDNYLLFFLYFPVFLVIQTGFLFWPLIAVIIAILIHESPKQPSKNIFFRMAYYLYLLILAGVIEFGLLMVHYHAESWLSQAHPILSIEDAIESATSFVFKSKYNHLPEIVVVNGSNLFLSLYVDNIFVSTLEPYSSKRFQTLSKFTQFCCFNPKSNSFIERISFSNIETLSDGFLIYNICGIETFKIEYSPEYIDKFQ